MGTKDKINGDCKSCDGRGIIMENIKGGKMKFMINEKKCNVCNGEGIDPEIEKCNQ